MNPKASFETSRSPKTVATTSRERGPATAKIDHGPAAGVTWNLGDLYAGPDDPRIAADLAGAIEAAQRFAQRYRGRVAELDAAGLAAAVDELERFEEPAYRAAVYAQLLFAGDTAAPRHGALLQHVQERSTEVRNAVVFFELEWVALPDERAAALLAAPALAAASANRAP